MDETSPDSLTETPSRDLPNSRLSADDVAWRELQPGLLAERANNAPVGIIEHGRRYSFTGTDDHTRTSYRTLADAQDAATGPIQVTVPANHDREAKSQVSSGRRPMRTITLIPAVAAGGGIVAGGIALAVQLLLN